MSGILKKLFTKKPRCAAVVAAGGSGSRMGSDKLFADLGGLPVLARTLLTFEKSDCIREIVVVVRQEILEETAALVQRHGITKVKQVVLGGATRAESVQAGVRSVSKAMDLVAVHDGARPLVTDAVIRAAVEAAGKCGAAAPAVPVKDTIKRAENGLVTETPPRESLWAVQTPQVFRTDVFKAALEDAVKAAAPLTDDCMAMERLGHPVRLTAGDETNLKITTPPDLLLAETILQERGELTCG